MMCLNGDISEVSGDVIELMVNGEIKLVNIGLLVVGLFEEL